MKRVLQLRFASIAPLVLFAISTPGLASIQIDDFTGPYAVGNWTEVTEGDSSVDKTGAPASVQLIGSDTNTFVSQHVLFTIVAAGTGLFEFDWDYFTEDFDGPEFDPAFYYDGVRIQLTNDGGSTAQFGSVSVPVSAGATIGWEIESIDDSFGRATLTITNFSAPAPNGDGQIPEPMSIAVWGGLACMAGFTLLKRGTFYLCGARRPSSQRLAYGLRRRLGD
jgi:hypothetical protein